MNFLQKLDYLMNFNKISNRKELAEKSGIPYTTIMSFYNRSYKNITLQTAKALAKALNVAVDFFVDDINFDNINIDNYLIKSPFDNGSVINIDDEIIKIPVFGTIRAGIPIESQSDIIDYVDIPKNWINGNKKFYGLKISGDSMSPKYSDNDIVIFEQNDDLELFNGKDVAVMINGTESTFKKIIVNDHGIILQPYNTDYDVMIYSKEQVEHLPIKVVGIAVEKRTKIN